MPPELALAIGLSDRSVSVYKRPSSRCTNIPVPFVVTTREANHKQVHSFFIIQYIQSYYYTTQSAAMSHVSVNSIFPADEYNRLIIDHDATERAELLDLKRNQLPGLFRILEAHGVSDLVEPHLLHRHFILQQGEAVVHQTLEIPATKDTASLRVDIAKAIKCPPSINASLVPLLWMVSANGGLTAYEYGLDGSRTSPKRSMAAISPETWDSFGREFSAYVHSAGIADLVSLKDRSCINGGEYVVPSMRVLFRVPARAVSLQPGSGMLESGWAPQGQNSPSPECTDGHVTRTRQTTAGTVAHYHAVEESGPDAFDPDEVPLVYTDAMWAAAKSENFWTSDQAVGVVC